MSMRIAVLRGGPSKHYDESLKTGEFVLSHLRKEPEKFKPIDVFISKDGEWHVGGKPYEPHHALRHVDLVWNALHGEYGEDGKVGQLLSKLHVPHTGSTSLGLAISMNKDLAKRAYETHGLLTPKHEVLPGHASHDDLIRIFRTYLHPVMVKPVTGRGAVGIRRVHSFEELGEAVAEGFKHAERVMVEEYVRGKEAVCGVLEHFRKERLYALLPVPNDFKSSVHKEIERMSKLAHEVLHLRHYSASDFIVTPKGKVYILETNALPDLTHDSHISKSLKSVGVTHEEFVNHIISVAKRPVT